MIGGTAYETAHSILQRTFQSKYRLNLKVMQSQIPDMYSYVSKFQIKINGVVFDFATSTNSFETASDELFEILKQQDIPDLWLPYLNGMPVTDDTMVILSGIFQIKYIEIGGLYYNRHAKQYAQEVTIHGHIDRYIFTGDLYRDFKKEVAEYFMTKYPEYLI